MVVARLLSFWEGPNAMSMVQGVYSWISLKQNHKARRWVRVGLQKPQSLILGILLNWEEKKGNWWEIVRFKHLRKLLKKKQNNYRDPKMTTRMWPPTDRHVSEINMLKIALYYLSLNVPQHPGFEDMSLKIQVSCCGLWDSSKVIWWHLSSLDSQIERNSRLGPLRSLFKHHFFTSASSDANWMLQHLLLFPSPPNTLDTKNIETNSTSTSSNKSTHSKKWFPSSSRFIFWKIPGHCNSHSHRNSPKDLVHLKQLWRECVELK